MMSYPNCPQCHSDLTYHDGIQLVCPECAYEWQEGEMLDTLDEGFVVKDANGTVLQDGDTVVLIKDLKVKGSSLVIKQGTKVKGIRLQEGDHNIACKIDGSGMDLKSEFVKKA
ncbi:zinc ribbon domain-containing protein YjdM [Pelistega ratti]|nr:zinc ribbon domain-containing protein YjdM [Pelistega ratti]